MTEFAETYGSLPPVECQDCYALVSNVVNHAKWHAEQLELAGRVLIAEGGNTTRLGPDDVLVIQVDFWSDAHLEQFRADMLPQLASRVMVIDRVASVHVMPRGPAPEQRTVPNLTEETLEGWSVERTHPVDSSGTLICRPSAPCPDCQRQQAQRQEAAETAERKAHHGHTAECLTTVHGIAGHSPYGQCSCDADGWARRRATKIQTVLDRMNKDGS